jgi:hypothetical protein
MTEPTKSIADITRGMGKLSDPVQEALRQMLHEFGDDGHYHECRINNGGPCDCFAGSVVEVSMAKLMIAFAMPCDPNDPRPIWEQGLSSPAPLASSLPSGESDPSVMPDSGAGETSIGIQALEALRAWFKFQSAGNTNTLYNAAAKLFGSDFNTAEYDDVE